MAARLGHLLYWISCGFAVLGAVAAVVFGVVLPFTREFAETPLTDLALIPVACAAVGALYALFCHLVGVAACYVLAGENRLFRLRAR